MLSSFFLTQFLLLLINEREGRRVRESERERDWETNEGKRDGERVKDKEREME